VPANDPEPSPDKFESYDAFVKAQARWEARQELREQSQAAHTRAAADRHAAAEQTTRTKFVESIQATTATDPEFLSRVSPDVLALKPFAALAPGEQGGPRNAIAQELMESAVAPQLMLHFSQHPEELRRLETLAPRDLIREFGRLEARLEKRRRAAGIHRSNPNRSRCTAAARDVGHSPGRSERSRPGRRATQGLQRLPRRQARRGSQVTHVSLRASRASPWWLVALSFVITLVADLRGARSRSVVRTTDSSSRITRSYFRLARDGRPRSPSERPRARRVREHRLQQRVQEGIRRRGQRPGEVPAALHHPRRHDVHAAAAVAVFTTVNVNQPFGLDFEFDSIEQALKMERGRERVKKEYIDPAIDQIAQEIESRFALFAYQNTPNIVGVLGTDPTSFTTINQARQRMVELACPAGDKGLFIPPAVNTALVAAGISYMNPQKDISEQYRKGYLGVSNGFKCYENMSLYSHTAGTWAGAVTINGAGQSGSSLTITATAGDTFKKGDVVSCANVNPVNPARVASRRAPRSRSRSRRT
jgi:hypothetical protein